jgi:hypothetical protein
MNRSFIPTTKSEPITIKPKIRLISDDEPYIVKDEPKLTKKVKLDSQASRFDHQLTDIILYCERII